MKPVQLSAIQPSNAPTLGNYLGAVRQWASDYEKFDSIFFVVNSHVITVRHDPKELAQNTRYVVANLIASGLDPEKCTLFVQSQVPEHAELAWILTCHSTMGELSRMTQFKDKSKSQGDSIPTGLFTYPVLMAADILLYQTNFVPVGEDQKQHVEITRDIALRMNNLYGKPPLFTMPEPKIPALGARILSLQDPTSKMSKSDPDPHATVFLSDSDDVILKKFKRAVTDSGSEIRYTDEQPGVKNLLTIQSVLSGKKPEDLVEAYRGKQYGHLKIETAEKVIEAIRPIRERTDELLKDSAELDRILKVGAERARARATRTVRAVMERVGLLPPFLT